MTKEYRGLVRYCRDLEHEVKTEMHVLIESRKLAGTRLASKFIVVNFSSFVETNADDYGVHERFGYGLKNKEDAECYSLV